MAVLVSPGVDIEVSVQGATGTSGPGTVPLIILATAANKTDPSGTGIASGTLPTSTSQLYAITSQRELLSTFGNPVFYSNQGTPLQGYELNEYGLLAAYDYLGIANQVLVLRAALDLAQLFPTVFEPTQQALTGTYWFNTGTTSWGIFSSNGNPVPGLAWSSVNPIVVSDISNAENVLLGNIGFNALTVQPISIQGPLTINGTAINLLTSDSISAIVSKINAQNIPNIVAGTLFMGNRYFLYIRNLIAGPINISVQAGSPILAELGWLGVLDFLQPNLAVGVGGSFAVVTLSNDNVYYQKITPVDLVGNPVTGGTPWWYVVGSAQWMAATPTIVYGSTIPLPYPSGDEISLGDGINTVTVTMTGTTVAQAVTDINTALALLPLNVRPTLIAQNPGPGIIITNYTGGPVVITDVGNTVQSVTIQVPGSGYTQLPIVTFSLGGGTGAAADEIFGITSSAVARAGNGYTTGDILEVTGGTFTTQGTLVVASTASYQAVNSVSINNAGGGYGSSTFDVTVVGGTGIPAVINVTSAAGIITTINSITSYGHYSSPPTSPVSVTGGTGTLATLNLTFVPYTVVSSASIANPGSGYSVNDVLSLPVNNTYPVSAAAGNHAAKITVTGVSGTGAITGFSITDGGEYVDPPINGAATTVSPAGGTLATFNINTTAATGQISLISVSNPGRYTVDPTVSPGNPFSATSGTGKNAQFTLTTELIDSGVKLAAVGTATIDDPGYNYVVGDFVTALGGTFSQATRLQVTSIQGYSRLSTGYTMVAAGSGYSIGDVITVGGGTFTTAAKLVVTGTGGGGTITGTSLQLGGQYTLPPTATASTTTGGIAGGGTGYGNAQTFDVTVVGGTGTPAVINVTSNAGGAIVTVNSMTATGAYTSLPTNPVSVTGGTGLGATFNMTFTGPATTVSPPGGTGATFIGPIQAVTGGIASVGPIINSGEYTVIPPAPVYVSTTGNGLAAAFSFTYGIGQIIPTNGGNGYTSPPSVTITPVGPGAGAQAIAVLGHTTATLTALGISSKAGNSLFYAPHYQIPVNSTLGDVWVKTTTPNAGANYMVSVYSRFTQQWTEVTAPFFANDDAASRTLGTKIAAGALYVQYNLYGTTSKPIASQLIKRWAGPNPVMATGTVVGPTTTPGDRFSIEFLDTTFNPVTVVITLTGSTLQQAVIDTNNALSLVLNASNIVASQNNGVFVISNTSGMTLTLQNVDGTPLSDLGLPVGVVSNWVALAYEARPTAPTTTAADGTLWYNPDFRADIMYNTGTEWIGYRNQFPSSDPGGVIFEANPPTTQSTGDPLVQGDIWISTSEADLENYPKVYVWEGPSQTWTLIDNSDHTSAFGIVFSDARWTADGSLNGSQRIEDMLVSNFVDPDAANPVNGSPAVADPRTFPTGTLLFNTRYSTYNAKQWQSLWLQEYIGEGYNVGNATFPPGTINTSNTGRWVTESGNDLLGRPYMGRKAQRRVIVKQLRAAAIGNQDIRAENVFFNLIATPGYVELIADMVSVDVDKHETAFIVADTPIRLPPTGTAITQWVTNAVMSGEDSEEGLATQAYTYMALYYPWGLGTNVDGSQVAIPPSAVALRTMAFNDQVSYPWFAPAGFNRGLISNASAVGYLNASSGNFITVSLNQGQRDILYTNNINPFANIPGRGLVVYGQKDRNSVPSAIDRVNVARLINYLRFQFNILAQSFLFEPNDAQTRASVKSAFQRFLANLIGLRALYDFAVVCDETNNTPARIDRNELWIDIAIEPVKAIEFIYIPVRVVATGTILPTG